MMMRIMMMIDYDSNVEKVVDALSQMFECQSTTVASAGISMQKVNTDVIIYRTQQ